MASSQQPYGPWVLQSPAELRPAAAPPPRVRLLCLPPAGAGASYFFGWGAALPDWVEVLPVELPGRNSRIREPRPVRVGRRADGIAALCAAPHRACAHGFLFF
jgi:surfactin synthase thioesterase subunit